MRREELETAQFALGDGTIGWVADSGEPLIVHNALTDPLFTAKSDAAQKIRSSLTVPLMVKGKVIGTLEVCNKIDADKFTIADQRLLSAFAAQAAIAIDNARLYQEVSLHLEEVLLLNKLAEAATATLDFGDVIYRSMKALAGIRNFERIHILLVDEASGELWLHPSLSDLFEQREDYRIPLGKGITGRVAATGEPLRIGNVQEDDRYITGYPDTLSELAVPLRVGDRIIGVLDTQSTRQNAYTEADQRLLTTLASQLSTVLDNVRLFEEAQLRVRELTALTQVSQALNEAKNLDTILNIVLEETFELIGSTEGSILLIEPPGSDQLRMVAERGLGRELMEEFNDRPVHTYEGTYQRALKSGQIVEVPDISMDPDFLHDVGSKAKRITNIPLMTEGGAIGVIAVDELPQDDTTRRLLAALAGMAAVAIDKERLHQETIERLAEVSTLYTLSNQITSSLSSSLVLESIVTILRLTLDCRACSIFLLDPTGEYLRLEAASGPSSTWKGVARLKVGEGVSGRVITERRSIYVPDTHAEHDFIFFDPQIRSLLSVPLVVRDEAVGTLSIDDTRPNAFDNEIRLLTIAAAQAAVAIENAQLYESLQTSYTELEQAYHELRELDKMKSEFVQTISHELRTPLTFIKGYVELLQDGDMGELNEEQTGALDIVSTKASALSKLVDDILSLQKASRERMQFDVISLAEVGHEEIQAAKASAMQVGLKLDDEISDGLPPVLAERQRLCQVFHNLLGNAIKFSNPDDTVTVRMFEDGDMIRTEVQDTGIGIPEDKLSRLFDRFYQVDSTTTRRFGGTGLGLAITKQIVEAHGGQVGVESRMDEGSMFWFTIPIANTE
jgi:signal transduction histidine kinase